MICCFTGPITGTVQQDPLPVETLSDSTVEMMPTAAVIPDTETIAAPQPPRRSKATLRQPTKTMLLKLRRLQSLLRNKHKGPIKHLKHLFQQWSKNSRFNQEISTVFNNLTPAAAIFIKAQLKYCGRHQRSHIWTNEEKALSVAIYKSSPKCYRFLKKIFDLPSARTLQRTLNTISLKAGLNNDNLFTQLSFMSESMKSLHRYCILMFDEVYLQPNVSMNLRWNSILGLQDLGEGLTKYVADHALVFMIRGINNTWKQPVCFYFVRSSTKTDYLKVIIKDVVRAIHKKTKFIILASVCDQGASNRSAISQLSRESGFPNDFIYTVKDVVNNEHKVYQIFHLFDPPHLMKCIRNHFLAKDIYFGRNVAKWSDLKTLYTLDGSNPDGKICVKLTEKHINPEGRHKMKVKLASQVFSRSVYAGLTFAKTCGVIDNQGTAEFVFFMDKLFDSLNGVRTSSKPLRRPLTDSSDHNTFWGEAKPFLDQLIFKKGNATVQSPPSVKNFIVTIRNIQALWKHMKDLGFKYLLTRCLNQDPLENFFGIIRGLCGQNYRPTCSQFISAFKTCLINNLHSTSTTMNCEHDGTEFLISLLRPISEPQSTTIPFAATFASSSSFPMHHPNGASNLPKSIVEMRIHTSSYIAGFIYKKFIMHGCTACDAYFLSEECCDSHAFIRLKDYGGLLYPSQAFIDSLNEMKGKIFNKFFSVIDSPNIFSAISDALECNLDICNLHNLYNNAIIKKCVIYIMIKYCCQLLNKKMNLTDLRPNTIVDTYLKLYGITKRP